MLEGRSIKEIATELDRQRKSKFDFIVPTSFLGMTIDSRLLNTKKNKAIAMTDHAHQQLGTFLNIPNEYYRRMQAEEPALLKSSVDTWMAKKKANRMIRTMDGVCRAFLSDRFLPIDNWDVLNILLPSILEAGCKVVSAEVTDKRLYVKAVTPKITGEIRVGEKVQAGLIIQNSEIGLSRVEVSPLMYKLACLNGLVVADMSLKRHHVGRRINEDDLEANGIYSRETIAADIKAFLLKARDSVKAVLDQTVFNKIVAQARVAAGEKIDNIEEVIEDVTGRYSLNDDESKGILNNFISGGDTTRWGLINAITATAHNVVTDYDRSTEFERIGGELLKAA